MQQARHYLSLAAVAVMTLGLGGHLPTGNALAENSLSAASRITAVYRVDLAGFNLGNFNLTTVFRGDDYEMRGEARFSILQGLVYQWNGTTASTGRVTSAGPEPAMYALSYSDGGRKTEQLRMTFGAGAVTEVQIVPDKMPNPRDIPVTKAAARRRGRSDERCLLECALGESERRSEGLQPDAPRVRRQAALRPRAHAEARGERAAVGDKRLYRSGGDLPRQIHSRSPATSPTIPASSS